MTRKRIVPVIAAFVLAGVGVAVWAYHNRQARRDAGVVAVSGNIELTDVELSFRIAGWVRKRIVSEGEMVKAGQEVAVLDSTELAEEAELRKAEVRAAQAALAELEAGSRPEEIAQAEAAVQKVQAILNAQLAGSRAQEIAAGEATVSAAQVDVDYQKLDFNRIRQLHEKGVATAQEFDTAKARYDNSVAKLQEAQERLKLIKAGPRQEEIEQARASLGQAQATLALVRKGPRKEVIEQSRARLEQARQSLAIAQTRLGYATMGSPVDGVVLSENVESGEFVAAGTPIVTVGDLLHVWLRAYIDESDLGRVKVGQPARLTADTYPGKVYAGKVSFISSQAEFTPKNVQTKKERVKLVYRVKIDLDNPDMELKPGMPADAEIIVLP